MLSATARADVQERSGGLCEGILPNGKLCLSQVNLEIHHIIPKRMGGRKGLIAEVLDQAWNLMHVCRSCHSRCQGTYKLTADDRDLIRQHLEVLNRLNT